MSIELGLVKWEGIHDFVIVRVPFFRFEVLQACSKKLNKIDDINWYRHGVLSVVAEYDGLEPGEEFIDVASSFIKLGFSVKRYIGRVTAKDFVLLNDGVKV